MNRELQFQLYQDFIVNCTTVSKSVKNYSDFKRINECLSLLFPAKKDVSILDFDNPIEFEDVISKLLIQKQFVDYEQKGGNQYSNTLKHYLRFLYAKMMFSKTSNLASNNIDNNLPLQTIFYGAPGTGKSYKIKAKFYQVCPEENIFRTTFHPDYDYANFVGCYKPTKTKCEKQEIVDYITLVNILKDRLTNKKVSIAKVCEAFGYEFHDSIIHIQKTLGKTIDQLQKDAYSSPSPIYNNIIEIGMEYYERQQKTENKITYSFIPQVFTNAYIKAWEEMKQENPQPVYLVIEEINRGNCAQIFGDLFQLLDRNENGYSEYPIDIDEDLKNYLVQELGADSEGIKDGKLCLPPNLNLLATMNTSDQSLFPMDSAFKRRWDWEFVPIRYSKDEARDEKDNFHTFEIEIGDKKYKWTDFLQKVNEKILSVTDSEDKQMGEYFIKKSINQIEFINKVMYYLWSEVGKDNFNSTNNALFVLPDGLIKETKDGKEEDKKEFSFNELFKDNATKLLQGFMKKLEVKSEDEKAATPTPATPAEV